MPLSVVREELESLNIRVQEVTQLPSDRRDQDPAKDHPPTPTSLYQWREGLRCQNCDRLPNSPVFGCRLSRTWLQGARCNVSAASALATRIATADTNPVVSVVWAPTSPLDALPSWNNLSAVAVGETTLRTIVCVCVREVDRSECCYSKSKDRTQPKKCRHRPNCRSESSAVQYLC